MPDAAALPFTRRLWAPVTLGLYAAAIALAPDLRLSLALAAPLLLIPVCWWTLLSPSRWVLLFLGAALLLPPLPIRLGDSGPHVAVAVAALGLLVGIMRLADWRLRPGLLPAAMIVYLGILLASAAVALLNSGAAVGAATLARVLLFGISLYVFFYTAYGPAPQRPAVALLFWIAVGSAVFGCIDFYFQLPAPAGFGAQFVWLASGVYRRAQGFFYEASTLGNLCAFFLVMIATALLGPARARPVSRLALLAGGIVFSAALIFSFSRAPLVNLAVAVLVLLVLRSKRIRGRRLAMGAAITVIAAVLAAVALPEFTELYWGRLRGTFEFVFASPEAVLSGRADTWRLVGNFLLDHPVALLIGVGYKTLPYSNAAGGPLIVDNMYLSLLAETGIAGLAAVLLFNAAILRAAWKAARHADAQTAFFGAWMLAFWSGQCVEMLSSDVLTYWRVLPVYFYVLALAVRGCDEPALS